MDEAGKEGGRGVGAAASGEERKGRGSRVSAGRGMGEETYSHRLQVGVDPLATLPP